MRLLLATVLSLVAAAPADACTGERWVGAWAAPPSGASGRSGETRDETVRVILTPVLGGSRVRVRLSNRFGRRPVTFASATVARRAAGADVVPETLARLTFAGRTSATAAPGEDVVSDPVGLRVRAFEALAVSVHVPHAAGAATEHHAGRQTSYLTPDGAGDHAADPSGDAFTQRTTSRPFVTAVDVTAPGRTGAVVALGDSITDGSGAGPGASWPELLARRVRRARRPLSVLNAGIGGNRVLRGGDDPRFGPPALDRLDTDVLQQAGVSTVILLEGINDLGRGATAAALIDGLRRLVRRSRAAGLRVVHGTLTPARGYRGGHGTAATDRARRHVNRWIRTRSPADAVVDFDAAVRDPRRPRRLRRAYDSGDHLHLDRAGYRAMARAVRLSELRACGTREGQGPAATG